MNKDRRKAIDAIIARVDELATATQALIEDIRSIRDEEQEYFDNMPESLQGSERGTAAEEAISQLEDAADTLDGFYFDEVTQALEKAKA